MRLDTNIPIYAVSSAAEDAGKRRRSLDFLAGRDLVLSGRVLQELHVQETRPSRPGALTHEAAVNLCEALQRSRYRRSHST